jgi:hypothetical protein
MYERTQYYTDSPLIPSRNELQTRVSCFVVSPQRLPAPVHVNTVTKFYALGTAQKPFSHHTTCAEYRPCFLGGWQALQYDLKLDLWCATHSSSQKMTNVSVEFKMQSIQVFDNISQPHIAKSCMPACKQ